MVAALMWVLCGCRPDVALRGSAAVMWVCGSAAVMWVCGSAAVMWVCGSAAVMWDLRGSAAVMCGGATPRRSHGLHKWAVPLVRAKPERAA